MHTLRWSRLQYVWGSASAAGTPDAALPSRHLKLPSYDLSEAPFKSIWTNAFMLAPGQTAPDCHQSMYQSYTSVQQLNTALQDEASDLTDVVAAVCTVRDGE